jgi:hypothetical protein
MLFTSIFFKVVGVSYIQVTEIKEKKVNIHDCVIRASCPDNRDKSGVEDSSENEPFIELSTEACHIQILESDPVGLFTKLSINLTHPLGWSAGFELEYTFRPDGFGFTCHAKRYRASNNGRRSGNVILGFDSLGMWGPHELTNDDGRQDGQWHDIHGGGTVFANRQNAFIYFRYTYDLWGPDSWISIKGAVPFVFQAPTITDPGVVTTPRPEISGYGIAGSLIMLYEHTIPGVVLASTTVRSDNSWGVQLERSLAMADPFRLTARQTFFTLVSDYAQVKSFAVLFKPVIFNITVSADGKPTISGAAGLKDATLEIFFVGASGGVQLVTTVLADGTWSVSSTKVWNPGIHDITARQISRNTEAHSEWAEAKSFEIKPPKPMITPPDYPAMANESLAITGVVTTVAVTLQLSTEADKTVAGIFSGSGATRTFKPTEEWAAGITRVKVVQAVDGIVSDPSAVVAVAVKPAKPVITAPPNPAMANQALTITRVATTGIVTLQMSTDGGTLVAGSFTGNGSTRSFTPAPNWPAGLSRVKVVQAVDGIASDPSAVVTVAVKPAKPVITAPPNPAMANQALTITGVATGVVILQMLTTGNKTIEGEFTGSGTSRTFKPNENWKPPVTTVWVVQTLNGVDSDPSEPVAVVVTEQLPLPVITRPLPRTSHLADVRVEGTCVAGATVAVQDVLGNSLQGKVTYSETTWSFSYLWLPGAQQIKAQQSMNGQTSEATGILEFFIKPAQPGIEPPSPPITAKQPLKITGVASGAVTLQMFTKADQSVGGEFTGSGAERLFTPTADWASGPNTVYVIQTVNGVDSDASDPCTFTVGETDRPDAPWIQQPQAGGRTSRFPTFEIAGLPGALHTVRFERGATLHEDTADADGILTFTVVKPLEPGTINLEVKQASGGVESDWSAPHRFTVKAPPAIPGITAPRADSETSRYPSVRGTGETQGEIVLRHAKEPQEEFALVDGSTRWSWTAKEAWPLGDYAVQARQTVDGDSSDWTEARSFKVRETRYAIGEANPAIGVPVVGTEQSVLLRVQVISGTTGEAAADVEVKWRINGTDEPLETTHTDATGWTSYRYTPETAGKHEILADITEENAGIALTELYEVNAILDDDWAQAAELCLDGARVDLAASDLVLLKKKLPYKLELKVGDDSVLIGSTVTLQNFWDVKERGLTFIPDLGMPQTINKGSSVHWYISSEEANSGFYGLSLRSPVLRDWELPGRVEAGDLVDSVKIDLDGFPQVFGGASAFPCLGAPHTLTVRPQDSSFLLGQDVIMELSAQAADLGVTLSPSSPQKLGEDGVSWSLNCVDSTNPGDFAVWLTVPALGFISAVLPMSLGHNKVKISKRFGPEQWGGSASYWRYGICATSTFTGQPAARVPVTVAVTGKPINVYLTDYEGWAYVHYYDGESASLTIRNRYDGSSV